MSFPPDNEVFFFNTGNAVLLNDRTVSSYCHLQTIDYKMCSRPEGKLYNTRQNLLKYNFASAGKSTLSSPRGVVFGLRRRFAGSGYEIPRAR